MGSKMTAITLNNWDGSILDPMLNDGRLNWRLFQAKASLRRLEASDDSRRASPQNSAVVGVALRENAPEFEPGLILTQFDLFAAGEESVIEKFLYYEPRASSGTVFHWEEAKPRERTVWHRLTAAVAPVRRYPVNWSQILFRQALAYNIDPNIPYVPNLDPREIRFRVLFRRVNLLLTGASFVATAMFAELVLRPRGVHTVFAMWMALSVALISYLVGKYAGIWQLCKLQDSNPEKFIRIVVNSSPYKALWSLISLLKWNPLCCFIALLSACLWFQVSGL